MTFFNDFRIENIHNIPSVVDVQYWTIFKCIIVLLWMDILFDRT